METWAPVTHVSRVCPFTALFLSPESCLCLSVLHWILLWSGFSLACLPFVLAIQRHNDFSRIIEPPTCQAIPYFQWSSYLSKVLQVVRQWAFQASCLWLYNSAGHIGVLCSRWKVEWLSALLWMALLEVSGLRGINVNTNHQAEKTRWHPRQAFPLTPLDPINTTEPKKPPSEWTPNLGDHWALIWNNRKTFLELFPFECTALGDFTTSSLMRDQY